MTLFCGDGSRNFMADIISWNKIYYAVLKCMIKVSWWISGKMYSYAKLKTGTFFKKKNKLGQHP